MCLRFSLSAEGPVFRGLVATAQSVLLTAVLTWPVPRRLDGGVLGCIEADTVKHLWTLWWIRHTILVDHRIPFQTDYVNFPAGMDIWPIEPLNGLAALLLAPLSVVALSNVLVMLNLTANGLCGVLFGRELTGDLLGGLVVGMLIQTSTFALFSIHVGVGELQHFWILPLGFWCLLRLLRTGRWRWAVVTGIVLGLGTLTCFYHGFFLGTGLLVASVPLLVRRHGSLRLLARLVVSAVIGIGLVVPLSRAFPSAALEDQATSRPFFEFVFGEVSGQHLSEPIKARLQPEDLVRTRSHLWNDTEQSRTAYVGGRLLGIPVLFLAAFALWRWPRRTVPWVAVALVGICLALGSELSVGGRAVQWGGSSIQLPFSYLNRALWFVIEPVHFPVRFLALTQVALAGLGGVAVMASTGWVRWVMLALALGNAVDIQTRQVLPYPMVTFELEDQSFLAPAQRYDEGAMLDLTGVWGEDAECRRLVMIAHLEHQRPVQSVPVDRLQFFGRDGHLLAQSLAFVEDLAPGYRGGEMTLGSDYRGDLLVLREAGFRLAMVNSQGLKEDLDSSFLAALAGVFGEPVAVTPTSALFVIPTPTGTAEEIEAWRAEHAARLAIARAADPVPGPDIDPDAGGLPVGRDGGGEPVVPRSASHGGWGTLQPASQDPSTAETPPVDSDP